MLHATRFLLPKLKSSQKAPSWHTLVPNCSLLFGVPASYTFLNEGFQHIFPRNPMVLATGMFLAQEKNKKPPQQ